VLVHATASVLRCTLTLFCLHVCLRLMEYSPDGQASLKYLQFFDAERSAPCLVKLLQSPTGKQMCIDKSAVVPGCGCASIHYHSCVIPRIYLVLVSHAAFPFVLYSRVQSCKL
jgi:hypothetical protein